MEHHWYCCSPSQSHSEGVHSRAKTYCNFTVAPRTGLSGNLCKLTITQQYIEEKAMKINEEISIKTI